MVELIQKETAFLLCIYMPDIRQKLDCKILLEKGGISFIECSERMFKEGELSLCGIITRLNILVIGKVRKVQ